MIDLKALLHEVLKKDLILDLVDAVTARALAAHKMIRDHADLDARRARIVEGRVRFPMQEKAFHEVCKKHGGVELDCDVLPGTDLKVFQPFMRFAGEEKSIILGFASIAEPNAVPAKNMSRKAGVSLNFHLQDRLDLDGRSAKQGDIFVLLLSARDRATGGMIREVAIGIVDSAYEQYLHYESIEDFLAGYADLSAPSPADDKHSDGRAEQLVKLKKPRGPYVAPGATNKSNRDEKKEDGRSDE